MSRAQHVAESWKARLADSGLAPIDRLLEESPDTAGIAGRWESLIKPGLGTRERWRWRLGDDGASQTVFVKRYRRPGWREQWDRILRQSASHSRACWEFERSVELVGAAIGAPRPVAFVEEMAGALERRSAVLLESVRGEAFDRAWCALHAAGAPICRGWRRHDLTRRLARFVAAFHGTGLCHRDLYLCHVFLDLGDAAGPPAFALIDLARAHRPRIRRGRWLIKDLSQLDASARQIGLSRSDRLRFLLTYLGLEHRAPRVRWYARRIVRKSSAILRRIARKSAGR